MTKTLISDGLTGTFEVLGECHCAFDCTCDWVKQNPGNTEFMCEFCGVYRAGKPMCNKCEK